MKRQNRSKDPRPIRSARRSGDDQRLNQRQRKPIARAHNREQCDHNNHSLAIRLAETTGYCRGIHFSHRISSPGIQRAPDRKSDSAGAAARRGGGRGEFGGVRTFSPKAATQTPEYASARFSRILIGRGPSPGSPRAIYHQAQPKQSLSWLRVSGQGSVIGPLVSSKGRTDEWTRQRTTDNGRLTTYSDADDWAWFRRTARPPPPLPV